MSCKVWKNEQDRWFHGGGLNERTIGTKQMQLDYYEMYVKTMDELAPEELKKKWKSRDYTGSTLTEKSTGGR